MDIIHGLNFILLIGFGVFGFYKSIRLKRARTQEERSREWRQLGIAFGILVVCWMIGSIIFQYLLHGQYEQLRDAVKTVR